MRTEPMTIPAHDERRISVDACCDPRTVRKYLLGGHVMPLTAERIVRSLCRFGFGDLVQPKQAA